MLSLPPALMSPFDLNGQRTFTDRRFDFTVWGAGVRGRGVWGEGDDGLQRCTPRKPACWRHPA